MRITILSESSFDYKYQNIFNRNPEIKVIEGRYFKLLKILIKNKSFYHIRYIKYRGVILTFSRIVLVYFASKISGSKIIWSCHNIYEHNIPSKRLNDILRFLLCLISFKVIVFHKDLIKYLPQFAHKKVLVASFGNFKEFIENKVKENKEFKQLYQKWLEKKNIKYPDIVSISAARRNNLAPLVEGLNGKKQNVLIIAPNQEIENKSNLESNILVYNNNLVDREILSILNRSGKLIGYIGHENISVPTSIYMYASFGIPIIGLNIEPVSTIIREYAIGEVIDAQIPVEDAIYRIKKNFDYYQKNCITFLQNNSWEKSASIHDTIFI